MCDGNDDLADSGDVIAVSLPGANDINGYPQSA
jgi:hypothetical protein